MDLSKIQPTFKKFENEMQAEKFLSRLSLEGGKKVDVIQIYPKGTSLYVWFYYDRSKIGYQKPEVEAVDKAEEVVKKPRKKRTKKTSN